MLCSSRLVSSGISSVDMLMECVVMMVKVIKLNSSSVVFLLCRFRCCVVR